MRIANDTILDGLCEDDKDILDEEYSSFLEIINSSNENGYYVYGLFDAGDVFYIGKGKNTRAYEHLKNRKDGSFKGQCIEYLYSIGQPPVIHLFDKNLTELEAFRLERQLIEKYGRLVTGDGLLINVMPGFVPLSELDKERKRAGGLALNLTGTRGGCFSKEWREQNKDKVKEYAKKAGKLSWLKCKTELSEEHKEWSQRGGKTTGKMKFWTNGKETTRSHECPGEGWYRGNGNFNSNSSKHSKFPSWTNGEINKLSEVKPGDNFFNGVTKKVKDDTTKKNVVVFSKQVCNNTIPTKYNFGKNIVDKEED